MQQVFNRFPADSPRSEVESHWRAAYPDLWRLGMRPPRWATSLEVWAAELERKGLPTAPWLRHALDGGLPGTFRPRIAAGMIERRPGWAGGHRRRY